MSVPLAALPKHLHAAAIDAAFYYANTEAARPGGSGLPRTEVTLDQATIELSKAAMKALGGIASYQAGAFVPVNSQAFTEEVSELQTYMGEKGLQSIRVVLDAQDMPATSVIQRAVEQALFF